MGFAPLFLFLFLLFLLLNVSGHLTDLIVPTDLSPLGCMPYLVTLDVSHNELSTVLDFKPPLGLRVSYARTSINFNFLSP